MNTDGMYTDSLEKEIALLTKLHLSWDYRMKAGDIKQACECPCCRSGIILTQYNPYNSCGYAYRHYCNQCGKEYDIGRLRSNVFFHRPYTVQKRLVTPFGEIKVKVNGKPVEFRFRNGTYTTQQGRPIRVKLIDIDVSNLKTDDHVFCGLDSPLFHYSDGDERSVVYVCEDDTTMLGICGYEPYEWEYKNHCFEPIQEFGPDGCDYKITAEPSSFDETRFYKSKVICLAVAWIIKDEYYPEPETELFLALTEFIY